MFAVATITETKLGLRNTRTNNNNDDNIIYFCQFVSKETRATHFFQSFDHQGY